MADTALGRVYRAALAFEKPGETAFADAAPYAPAGGSNASFIATPVFSGDTKLGVVAFMMPVAAVNSRADSSEKWRQESPAMNATAAKEVWEAARAETQQSRSHERANP